MIRIKFFAQLRENLGCGQVDLSIGQITSVADVKSALQSELPAWNKLPQTALLCAVNQQLAQSSTEVKDGDEVAFFPPVTGG